METPGRVLAIGDIHGRRDLLDALLDAVAPTSADHLVFLGDYVDRGPDSAGVLTALIRLSKAHRVTALLGNHEEMMLNAREGRSALSEWLVNGGDATLSSYGGSRATFRDIPPEHWKFLKTLQPYFENDTHLFVHANAYPDMPLAEQPDYMLRWERCDQSSPHVSGKTIVCGHTPQKSGYPLNRGHLVCLDTYTFGKNGALTCLDCSSGRVWQARTKSPVTRSHISDFDEESHREEDF